jgi:hypothetical protein
VRTRWLARPATSIVPVVWIVVLPTFVVASTVTVVSSCGSASLSAAASVTSTGGTGLATAAGDSELTGAGLSVVTDATGAAEPDAAGVGPVSPHAATTTARTRMTAPARSSRMLLPPSRSRRACDGRRPGIGRCNDAAPGWCALAPPKRISRGG